jgi:eukaryotic-like serine/threonine-protein kinase
MYLLAKKYFYFIIMIGTTLKYRYKIIKPLGAGGLGETYIAKDLDRPDHPLCVVKRLQPAQRNATTERLFNQEAKILSKLGENHPQIPKLHAYFSQETWFSWFGFGKPHFYIVQEYIKGTTFKQHLQEVKKLNENELIYFLIEVLEILDFVHKYQYQYEKEDGSVVKMIGVIHRDIKPENIMLRDDGQIFLIDFGIIKTIREKPKIPGKKTTTEIVTVSIGTPGYMPCEQAIGKPKLSSDIYALGMTAIQGLTGKFPTELPEDKNDEVIWRNLVNVSDNLADILTRMVKFRSGERYENAGEVLQALHRAFPMAYAQKLDALERRRIVAQKQAGLAAEKQKEQEEQARLRKLQTAKADYLKLDQLLAANNYKDADRETANLMLKIMNRENESYLTWDDCKNFPSDELRILDDLWVKYSDGRFGFSVQKQIWIDCGGTPGVWDSDVLEKFADKIGWKKGGNWLNYFDLTFNKNAPPGHLPGECPPGTSPGTSPFFYDTETVIIVYGWSVSLFSSLNYNR